MFCLSSVCLSFFLSFSACPSPPRPEKVLLQGCAVLYCTAAAVEDFSDSWLEAAESVHGHASYASHRWSYARRLQHDDQNSASLTDSQFSSPAELQAFSPLHSGPCIALSRVSLQSCITSPEEIWCNRIATLRWN